MTTMQAVFILLSLQSVLGALDNLWHHEWQARLPQRVSARRELALHAAREALYGLVFLGLAWFEWRGAMAGLLALMLALTHGGDWPVHWLQQRGIGDAETILERS